MNQGLANGGLAPGFVATQAVWFRAPLQRVFYQPLIHGLQARPAAQQFLHHGLIALQPAVVVNFAERREGGQPQVQFPVHLAGREQGQFVGQAQAFFIAPGQFEFAVGAGQFLQEPSANLEMPGFSGDQAQGRVSAHGPEHDAQRAGFVFQVHGVLGELAHGLAGYVVVPFQSDPLFHLVSSSFRPVNVAGWIPPGARESAPSVCQVRRAPRSAGSLRGCLSVRPGRRSRTAGTGYS